MTRKTYSPVRTDAYPEDYTLLEDVEALLPGLLHQPEGHEAAEDVLVRTFENTERLGGRR